MYDSNTYLYILIYTFAAKRALIYLGIRKCVIHSYICSNIHKFISALVYLWIRLCICNTYTYIYEYTCIHIVMPVLHVKTFLIHLCIYLYFCMYIFIDAIISSHFIYKSKTVFIYLHKQYIWIYIISYNYAYRIMCF